MVDRSPSAAGADSGRRLIMLWQDKPSADAFVVPDDVVDLAFRIDCPALPLDHALALCETLVGKLPWLTDEPLAAIHSIHGAASGNGWNRPDGLADSMLQLSKRTRLYLRLPQSRVKYARALESTSHEVAGYRMQIGGATVRPLVAERNVFCRSVAGFDTAHEAHFTAQVVEALQANGIRATKLLCGLAHPINTGGDSISARSVMLADLELDDSISLQQSGLGEHRLLGCGIFLPHKSIAAVGGDSD